MSYRFASAALEWQQRGALPLSPPAAAALLLHHPPLRRAALSSALAALHARPWLGPPFFLPAELYPRVDGVSSHPQAVNRLPSFASELCPPLLGAPARRRRSSPREVSRLGGAWRLFTAHQL